MRTTSLCLRKFTQSTFALSWRTHYTTTVGRHISNMAAQAIPVILIGRTEAIGKPMVEALKPEVEGELSSMLTRPDFH